MEKALKNIFILINLALLSSCLPQIGKKEKNLKFSKFVPRKEVIQEPLKASFKSVKANFIQKSCFGCHSKNQDDLPQFETKEDLIKWGPDIVFYAQEGCENDFCMPPMGADGRSLKPIPTAEVISTFKKWLGEQNEK